MERPGHRKKQPGLSLTQLKANPYIFHFFLSCSAKARTMNWSARPFVRILIFYLTGIFLAVNISAIRSISILTLVLSIVGLLLISSLLLILKISWQLRWLSGLVIGVAIALLAIMFTNIHFAKTNIELPEGEKTFIGVMVKQASESENSVKTVIKITELADSTDSLPDPIYTMAYFAKDSLSRNLIYGDLMLFSTRLSEPPSPKNPGEFDYGTFLKRNGIIATCYLQKNKWEKLGNRPLNKLVAIAYWSRNQLLNELKKNGLDKKEFAVAAAVILGYDDTMDTELQQDYAIAGAMHILCVSGLHVGIVYLVLNYLLGFVFKRKKWAVLTKTTLIILFMWVYALLTGLAPSVWRAALMLTIFIIGNNLNRSREPYNTLAAAAVIMLVINPMLVYNLGFQLSFAAVLGILIFYRPIYGVIYIKNKFLDKIWSIVVISTAAQLGTFPLAAHYFHFLPTYFWLTNIVIFPLSFAIISLGMAFIMLFWIPILSNLIGSLLAGIVFLMNQSVGFVKYLPVHGLENLYFPWIKVILIYGLIITLYNWLLLKNLKYILPTAILFLALIVNQTIRKYELLNQEKIIVYSLSKNSAINCIRGINHYLIMDTVLQSDQSKIDYHLKPGFIEMGLGHVKPENISKNRLSNDIYYDGELGQFCDFRFLVTKTRKSWHPLNKKFKIDAVIVDGKERLDIDDLSDCVNYNMLIIDRSVPYWKKNKLITFAQEHGIQYFDMDNTGAFIKDFSDKSFKFNW